MKTSPSVLHRLVFVAVLLVVAPAMQLQAQVTPTWQGTGTNWSDPANWDESFAFGQLEWAGSGSATSFNDLSSPQSQWRFYFNGSQAYTLSGSAVSFFDNSTTNGGILSDASVTQTVNMDVNFADNDARDMFILTRGAGGLTFGGAINLTNGMQSLGIGGTNASSVITFNGPITGDKPIIIGTNVVATNGTDMGATRVVFNGSNSYTGTTHLARGTLFITNNNSIGTNNLILGLGGSGQQATLQVRSSLTRTNIVAIHEASANSQIGVTNGAVFTISTNLINSSGANTATKFGKAGAGTLLLAGTASTYSGQIQIGQGTVIIGSSASLGANISTINRGIDLGLNVNDANQTNNVSLLLSNGVVLSNSIFVSANTISGTNYTRTIGLSGSGSATINNQIFLGGNLTLDAAAGNTITIGNNITNAGGLIKIGDGTLILSSAVTNNYAGGTLVSAGTLQGSATSLQGNITNNSVVRFNMVGAGTFTGVISGSGSVAKAGANITLSNVNTYTGGTTIEVESLIAGTNGALGTGRLTFSNAAPARLNLNGFTNTVAGLTVSGVGAKVIQNEGASASAGRLIVDLASGTDSSDATTIIRDASTGSGGFGTAALTKNGAGTLDLSVINSGGVYSGGLTVNGGALAFGAATNAVGSGAITLGGGALRYTATGSTNRTLANAFSLTPATSSSINVADSTVALSVTNVISGSGALTKSGAGTLVLAGANTYSGSTAVDAGTLTLATNGSLRFVIGGSGTNNVLGGTATAQLNGAFSFDLSSAATNTNATWTIVQNSVAATYGTNFLVTGFNGAGGNWTNTTNGVNYVFAQSSGVLSVQSTGGVTPYSAWVAYWQGVDPNFTNTAGTDNPDGDPFDNNEEFAFDGNPTIGTGALLTATKVGTNAVFNYVALTNTNAVTYQVQNTTNLSAGPWSNSVVTISNSANQSGISQTNSYVRREFVVPGTTNNFYRVQAAIVP